MEACVCRYPHGRYVLNIREDIWPDYSIKEVNIRVFIFLGNGWVRIQGKNYIDRTQANTYMATISIHFIGIILILSTGEKWKNLKYVYVISIIPLDYMLQVI